MQGHSKLSLAALAVSTLVACKGNVPPPGADAKPASDTIEHDADRAGAADESGVDQPGPSTPVTPNDAIDVVATHLALDVSEQRGTAHVEIGPGEAGATLEVGDLEIESVSMNGAPLDHRRDQTRLHLALPRRTEPVTVDIRYGYALHERPEGAYKQLSLTWPDHCGRIFPCHSDPSDGVAFSAELSGVPDGEIALFPQRLDAEAPAYMFGWTYGQYETIDLGTTSSGTRVRALAPANSLDDARAGTEHLRGAFDFLERTYGEYAFGPEVSTVWVDWGGGAYGGMEHHPHWHVASRDFTDPVVHVHEAAHGWFGNGVRIACWEDFVLSEALASYLAARALEDAGGPTMAKFAWNQYTEDLESLGDGPAAATGWPTGCGEHHVIADGIFGTAPYMRGAFFLRALERKVGRNALDASLRRFYEKHRGQAARFDELLDAIEADTGYDAHPCAESWLRSEARPAVQTCQ